MLKESGKYGGVVRKPLRIGNKVLPVGTVISPEQATEWPERNRMAMGRQELVFWFPAPTPTTLQPAEEPPPEAKDDVSDLFGQPKPLSYGAPAAEGGQVPEASPDQPPASDTPTEEAAAPADPRQPPSGPPKTPTEIPPIDPDTAEKSDLRRWLIAQGDEPPPALGEEKLRQRVRDKLAGINPPKEGD